MKTQKPTTDRKLTEIKAAYCALCGTRFVPCTEANRVCSAACERRSGLK